MVSDCRRGCKRSRTYKLEVERARSVMVSGCGRSKRNRTTYKLEEDRERDGVRLWTRMQTEQDNVLPGSGEGP